MNLERVVHFRRGLEVELHAVREAFGHDAGGVHAGVDADHVHEVGGAHGPAPLLHDLVDLLEVGAVAHQAGETAEVREQHPVDQEARAVVDHDRGLTHGLGVGNGGGDGTVGGLLATDNLNQRHHVYRVEEVHAAEVLRTLERLGQIGDGDSRGIGSDDEYRSNSKNTIKRG